MHHPTPVNCVEVRGPEHCNDKIKSHSRYHSVSGLGAASANSTSSSATVISCISSPVVYDPEDYRLPPEPQLTSLPVASPPASEWSPIEGHGKPVALFKASRVERS
jgi:hypothetical protein